MYQHFIKRIIDFLLALLALAVFSPLLIVLTVSTAVVFGKNPFFTQLRPGKDEKLFRMIKFRSMDDTTDKNGKLLPDGERLNSYGKFIRGTSLDELPSLFNILIGDMSIVGPRPLLVRDMVFMSLEIRKRHLVRPGLTGLAQCNGRNGLVWEKKFEYDLEYINHITFSGDVKIIIKTVKLVCCKHGVNEEGMATSMDFGDYLLLHGNVDREKYDELQSEAKELMKV